MYDELLEAKLRKAGIDRIPDGACERVLAQLAQQMQRREVFALPTASVSHELATVDWLCSEGVLAIHQPLVSFSHQTLFDFVFARWFVGQGLGLADYLRGSDQGLFLRPLTRQILEYLRGVDMRRFRSELAEMVGGSGIRAHLRSLVLGWLGQLPDPTCEELALLETHLAVPGERSGVLQRFHGNPAWFDLLGQARIAHWLGDWTGGDLETLLRYLASILPSRQGDVVSFLEPYLNRNENWNRYLAFVLARIEKGWELSSAELLVRLVRSPVVTPSRQATLVSCWARYLAGL